MHNKPRPANGGGSLSDHSFKVSREVNGASSRDRAAVPCVGPLGGAAWPRPGCVHGVVKFC